MFPRRRSFCEQGQWRSQNADMARRAMRLKNTARRAVPRAVSTASGVNQNADARAVGGCRGGGEETQGEGFAGRVDRRGHLHRRPRRAGGDVMPTQRPARMLQQTRKPVIPRDIQLAADKWRGHTTSVPAPPPRSDPVPPPGSSSICWRTASPIIAAHFGGPAGPQGV
jgi:hypothetical protein